MGLRFHPPDNEVAFEQMCLRFYRKHWKNDSLELYATRGEKQDGVDIHDPLCLQPVRAVQCKHHKKEKTLRPASIKEEVAKAEKSTLPIEHYVIATTAKKTKNAQNTVVKLNSRPASEKKFTVELHFWEDICELLTPFNRIQAELIVSGQDVADELIASILKDANVASTVSRLLSVGGDERPDGAFSKIDQLLSDRKLDVARHELDKLPNFDDLTTLSCDDQYKLLRLRAKLALEDGKFELASQLFMEAYEIRPNLEAAKINRVLAYSLIFDTEKAFELAREYVAEGLASPVMLCRLIENASNREQISEQMSLINPLTLTDENVNIALCHKLLQFGDCTAAIEAAERAIKISPDSPHSHFAAALPAHNAAITGDWRDRKSRLQSALKHYDEAFEGAQQKNYANLQPEILVNRAAAHMLLGESIAAADDYRTAVSMASSPAAYAACAVLFFVSRHEFTSAWELLEHLDQSTFEGKFLATITEFHGVGDNGERHRYLEQMKQLAEEDWPRAVECRFHCVEWALLLKDTALALSCITDKFRAGSPFQAYTALAWIAWKSNDSETAKKHADKALELSIHDARSTELGQLAEVFTKLDERVKAIDLLEQITTPGILNDDTKILVNCAQHLDRDDLLLRICRELRETGEQDDEMRRLELRLLNRYAPEQGFALADEFIQQSVSKSYFIAYKNLLAARLNCKHRSKSAALWRGVLLIGECRAHDPYSLILSKTCVYRMIDASHTKLRIVREMSDYGHGYVDEDPSRGARRWDEQA